MPDDERAQLQQIVDDAHAGGYQVRFWATPESVTDAREAVWRALIDAGVDQINTDHLPELEAFLKTYDPTER
ncbi:hypothetical protein GCM10023169_28280 [Georgenia halophila]|uniref:GP-PDE domain-containing protein n=1 Tax=Georgenia halophila TaxID=620889 RepID=A0ABP8LFB4_9MICO